MLYLPYILFSTISYVPGKLSVEQKLIDLALTGIFTYLSVSMLQMIQRYLNLSSMSDQKIRLYLAVVKEG